jgi:hypothetical protein
MADQIRATPRSPILGLFSDLVNVPLQYMSDPQRTQQMQGLASFIRGTGLPYSLESLSYDPSGRGLFTGAGGLGGTTRLRPEALEAALTVAPMVGPAARVAGRGAMAIGRAGERYAERVVPQIMERGGLPAEMVAAMGQGTQSPLTVYHGSPYRFNRFDPTKIGSGEGAQAYGYGHYVAEAPGVAKGYQETLSYKAFDLSPEAEKRGINLSAGARGEFMRQARTDAPPEVLAKRLQNANISARELPQEKLAELFKAYKEQGGGALYKIDLQDEQIARMLDYDKPLIQQPKEIQQKLKSVVDQQLGVGTWDEWIKTNPDFRDLQNDLLENVEKEKVAELIRQQGIPGIRYLDQGSRSNFRVQNTYKGEPYGEPVSFMTEQQAKDYAAEQTAKGFGVDLKPGTSNFVVFPGNEDLLRILEVDGQELLNPIMYRDPFGSTVR